MMIEKFLAYELQLFASAKLKWAVFALVGGGLFLFSCLTGLQSQQLALPAIPATAQLRVVAQVWALFVGGAVFWTLFRGVFNTLVVLFLGCLAMLLGGKAIGFYDLTLAWQSIEINTLALLFGMGLVSTGLAETQVFVVLARKLVAKFGYNTFALLVILSLVTYALSLFLNNLTTILLILPLTLAVTRSLRLNIVPFAVAEIIASNLGGASSMIGDFPNMLISSTAQIHFLDFTRYLMPICLINLAVMLLYFYHAIDFNMAKKEQLEIIFPTATTIHMRPFTIGAVVLMGMVILFILNLFPSGLVALIGAAIIFFASGLEPEKLLEKVRYNDLIFFILLFVLVGGIKGSGVLGSLIDALGMLSGGIVIIQTILLVVAAFFFTMFFNAGPSTAIFLPLFLGLQGNFSYNYVFWALSLGICAGSSAALTGATAGPVAFTIINNAPGAQPHSEDFNFKSYMALAWPLALLHLLIAVIYLILLYLFW